MNNKKRHAPRLSPPPFPPLPPPLPSPPLHSPPLHSPPLPSPSSLRITKNINGHTFYHTNRLKSMTKHTF